MHNRTTQTLALALTLILLITPFGAAQVTTKELSYSDILSDSINRQRSNSKLDEVQETLEVLRAGSETPKELTAALKRNYPLIPEGASIKVLPEMRQNLILKGPEYTRLVSALSSLLKLCQLENKLIPILYRSERPIVALSYPNAIIFSTRTLALLNDNEIEGIAAHELNHLVARELFIKAIDTKDDQALRIIELFCDAAGASLLQALNKTPRALITALYKIQQVLQLEFNDGEGKDHPRMGLRDRLNKTLIKEFSLIASR